MVRDASLISRMKVPKASTSSSIETMNSSASSVPSLALNSSAENSNMTIRQTVQALANGDLAGAGLSDAERGLLEYVGKGTEAAYRTTHEGVQKLRELGMKQHLAWAEAVVAHVAGDTDKAVDAVTRAAQDSWLVPRSMERINVSR